MNSPQTGSNIITLAHAKLNLGLRVLSRQEDGYHCLESLFAFVDLSDQLTFTPDASSFTLSLSGETAAFLSETDNLVLKAAYWLKSVRPDLPYGHFHVEKCIPVGAGLGGGASDAAAAMVSLLQASGVSLSDAEKKRLILQSGVLGADVPVCLAYQFGLGKSFYLLGSGRDTLPQACTLHGARAVLVNPHVPVPTAEVFQCLALTPGTKLGEPWGQDALIDCLTQPGQHLANDLLSPASQLCPEIGGIVKELAALSPRAYGLSGSGATCFALFNDGPSVDAAYHHFAKHFPHFWCVRTALALARM